MGEGAEKGIEERVARRWRWWRNGEVQAKIGEEQLEPA